MVVVALVILLLGRSSQAANIGIGSGARIDAPLNSMKDLRDQGPVKQRFGYSCGAAAVATILARCAGSLVRVGLAAGSLTPWLCAGLRQTGLGWRISMAMRAVFLDRDGVLSRSDVRGSRPYAPTTLDAFVVLAEAPAAVARLRAAGFLAIVVTNQKDVGSGKTPRRVMKAMHTRLCEAITLDAIKVCTCVDECPCYKPNTGMVDEAVEEFDIDLAQSYMVGDRWRDIDCGARAGCRTVFIDRGYKETLNTKPDFVATDVAEAAELILAHSRNAILS